MVSSSDFASKSSETTIDIEQLDTTKAPSDKKEFVIDFEIDRDFQRRSHQLINNKDKNPKQEFERISFVRIHPPLLVPKPIIRQASDPTLHEERIHPKSVRFTLNSNYRFIERSSLPRRYNYSDTQLVSNKRSKASKTGGRRSIQRRRSLSPISHRSSNSSAKRQDKNLWSSSPHPSKIIISIVLIAIVIILFVAKKKKDDMNVKKENPLELFMVFM